VLEAADLALKRGIHKRDPQNISRCARKKSLTAAVNGTSLSLQKLSGIPETWPMPDGLSVPFRLNRMQFLFEHPGPNPPKKHSRKSSKKVA
jgi:hypothetical protein